MFILMPFWSTRGGLLLPQFPKLNPASARPQKLFGASDFPYIRNHPRSRELLFEGEFNPAKKQFGNELPKWRLQSQGWTKVQWDALLKWMSNPVNSGLINYTCNGTDIAPGADDLLGPEWVYPAYVLDWCIEQGFISNEHQVGAINKRKREEKELGKDITEAPELFEPPAKATAKQKGEELAKEALEAMKKPQEPPAELFTPEEEPEPESEEESEEGQTLEQEMVEMPQEVPENKETVETGGSSPARRRTQSRR